MADKRTAGYSLVPGGDGGRSAGLIRRRTTDDEGGSGCGFLDLSLGSIYNNKPSSMTDDDGFSPAIGRAAFLPAVALAPLEASSSAVPSVVVSAATAAANALPAPSAFVLGLASAPNVPQLQHASPASAFTLGLAASAAATAPLAPPSRAAAFALGLSDSAANAPPLAPASLASAFALGHASAALPGGDANGLHGPPAIFVLADSDSGARPAPARRSKGAVALLGASPPSSPVPQPPNRKAPRGRRGDATGVCRRRSGASNNKGEDAEALANGGESAPPPFPWATKTVGAHPTLAELSERGIASVEGEVRCKRCDAEEKISYDVRAKFEELSGFILRNMDGMHDRAPPEWMYPALPDCDKCGQKNSLRPVIASEKWRINWLFLLLSQTLGLCTLEQLKHFCARTRQHRTGAKDRVLYSTYMELCNQLCPGGPFDMASERKNRTHPFA